MEGYHRSSAAIVDDRDAAELASVNLPRLMMTLKSDVWCSGNELELKLELLVEVSARLASLGKCGLINFYRLDLQSSQWNLALCKKAAERSEPEPEPFRARSGFGLCMPLCLF
jgi:hypothetical protein